MSANFLGIYQKQVQVVCNIQSVANLKDKIRWQTTQKTLPNKDRTIELVGTCRMGLSEILSWVFHWKCKNVTMKPAFLAMQMSQLYLPSGNLVFQPPI